MTARETAEKVYASLRLQVRPGDYIDRSTIIDAIAQALTEARAQGLEEAAEMLSVSADHTHLGHERKLLDHHAGLIRALKGTS